MTNTLPITRELWARLACARLGLTLADITRLRPLLPRLICARWGRA